MAQSFTCDNQCGFTAPTEDAFEFRLTRPAAMNRGDAGAVHLFNSFDCLSAWAKKAKKADEDAQAAAEAAAAEAEAARLELVAAQQKAQEAAQAAADAADVADGT